jgi:hypothetical protein
MSIHNLSAGSGYDYLTRQVAALDAIEKGHVGLASTTPNAEKVWGRGSDLARAASMASARGMKTRRHDALHSRWPTITGAADGFRPTRASCVTADSTRPVHRWTGLSPHVPL